MPVKSGRSGWGAPLRRRGRAPAAFRTTAFLLMARCAARPLRRLCDHVSNAVLVVVWSGRWLVVELVTRSTPEVVRLASAPVIER
jgi:hypothetical protein